MDQHRAAIAASVAEECAPVDARVTALARTVEGFDRRFDTVKTEAFEGLVIKRELVDAMESAETEKAFRQVHEDVARWRRSSPPPPPIASPRTRPPGELEAIVPRNRRRAARGAIPRRRSWTPRRTPRWRRSSRAQNSPRTPRTPPRKRAERGGGGSLRARGRRRIRRSHPRGDGGSGSGAIRAEMAEAKDQPQASARRWRRRRIRRKPSARRWQNA